MSGRVHIIGAGLAGLMTALELTDAGRETIVHEASPHLGGRCRSYHDPKIGRVIDNGTHALVGANPVALGLLARLRHREDWVAPPGETVPLVDLARGEARTLAPPTLSNLMSELFTKRRSDGLARPGPRDLYGLARTLHGRDRPVADLFADTPFYRDVIDPLTVAALNTRCEEASSALLAAVLKATLRGARPDTSREGGGGGKGEEKGPAQANGAPPLAPLIARRGLGPDLIDPLVKAIRAGGGSVKINARIDALSRDGSRVTGLSGPNTDIRLDEADAVCLAVPPHLAARLHPPSAPPGMVASPIVNLHVVLDRDPRRKPDDAPRRPGEGARDPLMVGVLGGASQWLAYRGDTISTTVSAADALAARPAEAVFEALWAEMRHASALLGFTLDERPRAWRVVKERWATLRQSPNIARPGPRTDLVNLVLAGDWTDTGLPFTIEGALRSGRAAAEAIKTRP